MKTAPELQQDVTLLMRTLTSLSVMADKLAPDVEYCHARIQGADSLENATTPLLFMLLRAQIDQSKKVIERIRDNNPDAELKQAMAEFDRMMATAK
jgi:hypothetical protein